MRREQVTDGKYASAGIARLCLPITCLAQPLRSHSNANVGDSPRMRFAQTQGALRRLCLKLSTTEDENCPPRKGKESASCEVHQRCCLLQNIRDAHLRRLDHPPSDRRRSPVSAKIYLFEGLGGNSHQGHAAPRLRAGQALCRRRLPLSRLRKKSRFLLCARVGSGYNGGKSP